MTPDQLREILSIRADPDYRDFHLHTCPQAQYLLGVRVPEQRKLAKTIIKGDFRQFLDTVTPYYYEEILITGIVIASAPMTFSVRWDYITKFLPLINNWAICDTFCASFSLSDDELPPLWEHLCKLLSSDREYTLRFVLVMFLDYFLSRKYLPEIFPILDHLRNDYYYVNMAKAWLIAEAFTKERDLTLEYIKHNRLEAATYNKAIQKARESRRISPEDKSLLASLRRR